MTTFNDIENTRVRTYNRAQYAMNLSEDKGLGAVTDYFTQFSEAERSAIFVMLAAIRMNPEEVKKQVLKDAAPV